jgi:hypothetical protein
MGSQIPSGVTCSDSLVFNLDIGADTSEYYVERGKSKVLLLKTFNIDTLKFSADNGFADAVKYYHKQKGKYKMLKEVAIYIMNTSRTYKKIWCRYDAVNVYKENEQYSYGISEEQVNVEAGWVNFRGNTIPIIRIIFTSNGFNGGYTRYILNFANDHNSTWSLINKERLNTRNKSESEERYGYCIDSVKTQNWDASIEPIYLDSYLLYTFESPDCSKYQHSFQKPPENDIIH